MLRPQYWLVALLLLAPLLFTSTAQASTQASKVQAEWVYSLIPYITWSSSTKVDITICLVGQTSIFYDLTDIVAKNNNAHSTIKIQRKGSDDQLSQCKIAYIGLSERKNYTNFLNRLDDSPILTISSINNFAENGGMIELHTSDNGISLKINTMSAHKSSIIVDSDLLGFADVISN